MKKLLLATTSLLAPVFCLSATVVDTNNNGTAITRSATVDSSTPTFFKTDPNRSTLVEVTGSGSGTMKVSTDYTSTPSSFTGFTPDPAGAVSSNAAWQFPTGLSYVGFDASSGTWSVKVTQPK
ncbi:hypothetical protein [Bradyrhizobium manausense]|uniref:hypothetical protein n=1 Tax=Bradyrhizobium manausense TaxID=989370 RepID=UPI001BA6BA8B|nr:hypothetical protein [Bradyrhizobium manausense]MBR0721761.1 hypothetical protein [Bradyrhizobium manausense]